MSNENLSQVKLLNVWLMIHQPAIFSSFMNTTLQKREMGIEVQHTVDVMGNQDLLCILRPDLISLHLRLSSGQRKAERILAYLVYLKELGTCYSNTQLCI